MKLRNKKTGEIVEPCGINLINGRAFVRFDDEKGTFKFEAHSLAEFNSEWEDCEEPKGYWSYDTFNNDVTFNSIANEDDRKADQEIGNYFATKEEAEKAVEKLKAWKRLKDKGFRFDDYDVAHRVGDDVICGQVYFKAGNYDKEEIYKEEIYKDLNLLFGGEE